MECQWKPRSQEESRIGYWVGRLDQVRKLGQGAGSLWVRARISLPPSLGEGGAWSGAERDT